MERISVGYSELVNYSLVLRDLDIVLLDSDKTLLNYVTGLLN